MLDATDGVREKPDARPLANVAGNVRYEDVTFQFKNSDQGVFDVEPGRAGRANDSARRPHRRRQDHDARPAAAAARARQGPHPRRRPRHRRRDAHLAAPEHGGGVPGRRPVQPLDCREHPHRPAGGDRRRGRAGGKARRGARLHLQEARRLRLRHRRARRLALGRRAPASRHRARHPQGRADPDPRRGHERARRGDGSQDQACARPAASRGAPLSSSPTGCPPSPTPTASWCSRRAASSSAAPSASWWRTRACSPGWWRRAASPSPCLADIAEAVAS